MICWWLSQSIGIFHFWQFFRFVSFGGSFGDASNHFFIHTLNKIQSSIECASSHQTFFSTWIGKLTAYDHHHNYFSKLSRNFFRSASLYTLAKYRHSFWVMRKIKRWTRALAIFTATDTISIFQQFVIEITVPRTFEWLLSFLSVCSFVFVFLHGFLLLLLLLLVFLAFNYITTIIRLLLRSLLSSSNMSTAIQIENRSYKEIEKFTFSLRNVFVE